LSQQIDKILKQFDGAALLTLRKLSPEELDLLVVWSTNNKLGAQGGVLAPRPQSLKKGIDAKKK
tara:strand:- start:1585 stop:1776 length:192 start_codon:yes stop_codon:yes gene_type:complete